MLKIALLAVLTSLFLHYNHYDIPKEDETENLNELIKKGKFEKGIIFNGNDYTELEILRFTRRNRTNAFLYCVVKDSTNTIRAIEPNEIVGYTIGTDFNKAILPTMNFSSLNCQETAKQSFMRDNEYPTTIDFSIT